MQPENQQQLYQQQANHSQQPQGFLLLYLKKNYRL